MILGGPVRSLIFAVTEKCNLRCRMCDIWEKQPQKKKELSLCSIEKISQGKAFCRTGAITLTGGEPFLREDLAEIFGAAKKINPKAVITISTNGTLTENIIRFVRQINCLQRVFIEISLHGLEAHDDMVGVSGAFAAVQKTLRALKSVNRIKTGCKFVITPWNFGEIKKFSEYCEQEKIPFTLKMIENVSSYTNTLHHEENAAEEKFSFSPAQIAEIVKSLKAAGSLRFADRKTFYGLNRFLTSRPGRFPCPVPRKSVFVGADGLVYRCRMFAPAGQLGELDLKKFLRQKSGEKESVCAKCVSHLRFVL